MGADKNGIPILSDEDNFGEELDASKGIPSLSTKDIFGYKKPVFRKQRKKVNRTDPKYSCLARFTLAQQESLNGHIVGQIEPEQIISGKVCLAAKAPRSYLRSITEEKGLGTWIIPVDVVERKMYKCRYFVVRVDKDGARLLPKDQCEQ